MSIDKLKKYADTVNIATDLSEEELLKIGQKVLAGYQEDVNSSKEWMEDVRRVMDLAALTATKKNTPLPNSANIKFPIITKACYEFSSRTYPEIVRDGKVVKARIIGKDFTGQIQRQADNVVEYMNYQLMFESIDWELELDRLLNMLALIGFLCKKTYYDPVKKQIKSEICDYQDLVINADVKSLEDARRISHVLHYSLNDLIEHKNADVYLEEPVDLLIALHANDDIRKPIDVIEQHTFLDLDGDNYEEPYIVTVTKDDGKVLRIAPRFDVEGIQTKDNNKLKLIIPIQLFTDYHFLVSPKGKFQSVGFGILMLHLNETINTLLNQLVDAGQLANLQGGYIDSRFKPVNTGNSNHDPGEWKKMKGIEGMALKDGIVPITYKEPSTVLYQLLGLLIASAKELSSSTELMTGGAGPENAKTGATQALIDQATRVLTSIQRRVYRSLTQEFRKIFILDSMYVDPVNYINVLNDERVVAKQDFDIKKVDIIPVADPNLSSEAQRAAKNQILLAVQALPGVDKLKATKRLLINSGLEHPEELMLDDQALKAPNPELIKVQAEIEDMAEKNKLKGHELSIREKEVRLEAIKLEAEIVKLQSEAIKNIAQAEAAEAGTNMKDYEFQLKALSQKLNTTMQERQQLQDYMTHRDEMNMRQQEVDNDKAAMQKPTDTGVDGASS